MAVEPGGDALEARRCQIAVQMGPHARHEGPVAGLAVAGDQPGKDTEDAGLVEGGETGIGLQEGRAINVGPQGEIVVQGQPFELGRDVAAGVLQQGVQVPGGMGADGVLKVDHPGPGRTGTAGQPDQVLGVIVAVGHDRGPGGPGGNDRGPGVMPFGHGGTVEGQGRIEFRQPVDEQIGPALQGGLVIGQQRPVPGGPLQDVGGRGGVDAGQGLDRRQIEGSFIRTPVDGVGEQVVAEILQHGETGGGVEGHDVRGRQVQRTQMGGDGGEGLDPPGRQTGHGVPALGPAAFGRPGRVTGGALGGGRLVHQHQGGAGRGGQPLVAAGRGVAGQGRAHGGREAGRLEEVETLVFAVRHGHR